MNRLTAAFVLLLALAWGNLAPSARAEDAAATTGHVRKVLTFLLDRKGQDSPSPSLFDRDAYQYRLRGKATNEISGVRVDVLWSVSHRVPGKYVVRAELRGVGPGGLPSVKTMEAEVQPGFFHHWTSFTVAGDDYKKFGSLIAWHATLWQDGRQLDEKKSFLW